MQPFWVTLPLSLSTQTADPALTLPPRPQRLFGPGNVFRQPLSVYSLAQFTAGIWALFAASTFWDGYRNWQDTGGHGATWPLMAFLLVLQV